MLSEKENEQMTRVGLGTPMGELFRRYWHPVAARSQMKQRSTFQVKILGENLVLYKDRSAHYGLVEPERQRSTARYWTAGKPNGTHKPLRI